MNPHALRHQILNLTCLPFHHPRSETRTVSNNVLVCNGSRRNRFFVFRGRSVLGVVVGWGGEGAVRRARVGFLGAR